MLSKIELRHNTDEDRYFLYDPTTKDEREIKASISNDYWVQLFLCPAHPGPENMEIYVVSIDSYAPDGDCYLTTETHVFLAMENAVKYLRERGFDPQEGKLGYDAYDMETDRYANIRREYTAD